MTMRSSPRVTGPISGGRRGRPFGSPAVDLGAAGYVEEEFFLEGEATRYAPVAGGTPGRDGRWDAEPAGSTPFRTRIVVYRPVDPSRFDGTLFVCWNNVSGGHDIMSGLTPAILRGGSAAVGVTVQKVGVHGYPQRPQGLRDWDPDRYGSLSIDSDDDSFDIFTQAARAIGPDRDRTVDPMAGLDVRHLVATGGSQSAGRLATYVNAIQPLTGAYDGFLLQLYFGTGTPLQVGDTVVNIAERAAAPSFDGASLRGSNLLRDDLDVPVMVVNSELEAIACEGVRQPDTDRFRWWEVAGTSHVCEQWVNSRSRQNRREFAEDGLLTASPGINRVQIAPVFEAALEAMRTWVSKGEAPPVQPRIEFAGEPADVARDEHGIARGGIRLPAVEEPLARHDAIPVRPDFYSYLSGSSTAFPAEAIRARYPDEDAYLERYEAATRRAVDAGVVLEHDVPALLDEAREHYREATAGSAA